MKLKHKKEAKHFSLQAPLIIKAVDLGTTLVLISYYRHQTCPESLYIPAKLLAEQGVPAKSDRAGG